MILVTPNHLSSVSVKVGNASVTSSLSVTNLGFTFDRCLHMNAFITRKCQSATLHLSGWGIGWGYRCATS